MPKHTRYPGIQAMSDGRKRIRVRAVDPRTGRMKEVDRVVTVSKEGAIRLQQEWRRDIHTADRQSAEVPRLTDYATSWMKSKAIAVKPSTAETYATVLDCHVMPAGGDQATVHRPWLPRTFNNIARQVAGEIVTRSITGHVTQAMTEHYSHVGREEKLAAAGSVVRLVFAAKMGTSGGSSGGSQKPGDPSGQP